MAQYNLTDNVADSFSFIIGKLEYNFRYPTTAEMRELSTLNNDLQDLAKQRVELDDRKAETDDEKTAKQTELDELDKKIKVQNDKSEAKMNELVTPVGHEVQIAKVLEDQPINVVRNFRAMMAKEINLG